MNLLLLFLLLLAVLYAMTVFRWRSAWLANKELKLPTDRPLPFISIVIALRNESANIPSLIRSLKNQKYETGNFEVILVNDHSTDQTAENIKALIADDPHFKLIDSKEQGKKKALREGITLAKGEVLVTTDADCQHHELWLDTIGRHQAHRNPDMTIAPVAMVAGNGLMSKLFELEFMALQLSTAGSAFNKQPIMCNGANLAFRKSCYWEANMKEDYISGDDMFLLINIKNKNGRIEYLKQTNALVTTAAPESYATYLKQRSRWLRKASGYSQTNIMTTATLMLAGNMAWPIAVVYGLATMQGTAAFVGVILFTIKYISDYQLLKSGEEFFNIRVRHNRTLMLAVLYPAMILSIGTMTLLRNRKKW